MKAIYIVLGILMVACNSQKNQQVSSGDSSRNALDWAGTYAGKLGSDSVQVVVHLNENNTYQIDRTPKEGKTEASNGSFSWNKQGGNISIDGKTYRVGENRIDLLDDKNGIIGSLTKLDNPLQEKYWKLVELMGKPVVTAEGQREAYIIFKSFDNRYNGNGGCNSYSGAYELLPLGRIKLLRGMSTLMACPDMDTEAQLHDVLSKVDTYIVSGDSMMLTKARMAPMARFEAVYLR